MIIFNIIFRTIILIIIIIIIIIIIMKMLYAPTAPALFGVSCWDNLQSIHD